MTSEQIHAMSAGPEMSAAVAESLGYKVERWEGYAVVLDAGVPGYPTVMDDDGKTILHEFPHHSMWVWPFSTDIAAAYHIVSKLSATHTFHLEVVGNSTWAAFHSIESQRDVEPDDGAYADGNDEGAAALAICRAALIAMAGRQEGQQ